MEKTKDKKEALKELLILAAENIEAVEKVTITLHPRKILQGTDKDE